MSTYSLEEERHMSETQQQLEENLRVEGYERACRRIVSDYLDEKGVEYKMAPMNYGSGPNKDLDKLGMIYLTITSITKKFMADVIRPGLQDICAKMKVWLMLLPGMEPPYQEGYTFELRVDKFFIRYITREQYNRWVGPRERLIDRGARTGRLPDPRYINYQEEQLKLIEKYSLKGGGNEGND